MKQKIASLDHTATRLTIPEGRSTTTIKYRILWVAAEFNIPATFPDNPSLRLHKEDRP
jgi:hypothetical protein